MKTKRAVIRRRASIEAIIRKIDRSGGKDCMREYYMGMLRALDWVVPSHG